MFNKKGQSAIEYSALIIIVIGALLTMGVYFKRGIAGRWRDATDEIADQYDPLHTDSNIVYRLSTDSFTDLRSLPVAGGLWTMRTDQANTVETKQGFSRVNPLP